MSNHVVAVNIVRQPSPFAPQATRTETKSFLRLEASVADLRKALLEDQVIQPGDKFYASNGQALSYNSELHTRWTEALQGILVVGSEDAPVSEKQVVHGHCIHKASIPVAPVQLLPIHAPIVQSREEVTQVIFNSSDSETSETRTVIDTSVVPIVKQVCSCTAQEIPSSPPIVVIPPVEVAPVAVETLQDTEIVCDFQPQVISESEPVVIQVVQPSVSECPCEICQNSVVAAPIASEPVVVETLIASGLQESEKAALIVKSALGYGVNISNENGPVETQLPVVAQVAFENVEFNATTESDIVQTVTVTTSARSTAYAKSSWAESCLGIEHPWVSEEVKSTVEEQKTITVTGSCISSKYTLTLSGEAKPHPEFEYAILKALEIENAARRSEELGNVFNQYGHVYATAVELGGAKYTTITRTLSENETETTLVDEMKSILKGAFPTKDVNDCPCPDCATRVTESSATSDIFETVGGITETSSDISAWQASLTTSANWAVIRVLCVESVINLFNEVIRAKILAVIPQAVMELDSTPITPVEPLTKVPLHRLFSPRSGIHFHCVTSSIFLREKREKKKKDTGYAVFYTTKAAEVDNAVRVFGYNYETLAAHILPEENDFTVPLYRIHRGIKHVYTIDLKERDTAEAANAETQAGHGLVGYVYATQQPNTFPLYRIFNPRTDAHLFTTNVNEKESLLKVGWADEGVTCYVYL